MNLFRFAFHDLKEACCQYRLWLHLGFLDVKQRYRRSVLGPWWISMSMLIFILAMGVIFSRLLSQKLEAYIPFFTAGFLVWSFISMSILESTELFKMHNSFIKQIKLPYSIYVFKFFTKNVIFLAHNFVVYILVIGFFKINPGWNGLLAIPGFILLFINLYWMCLLVSLICLRFRDMVPLVNSCMQILFFITPISWMPKLVGQDSWIVKLNPFVYFLEAVRQPLLGVIPSMHIWTINSCMALVGLTLSLCFFGLLKSRLIFWVD